MSPDDRVERVFNLLKRESQGPNLIGGRKCFSRNSHAEKTRLFIVRAIWSLPTRSLVAKSTSYIGVRNFHLLLRHYGQDLDFEQGLDSSNGHVKDLLWLCGFAALRIALKVEENPCIVCELLSNGQEALFNILPGLSSVYTLQNIIEFENKALQVLEGFIGMPISLQFVEAFLPFIGLDRRLNMEVYYMSTYFLSLLNFSTLNNVNESTLAVSVLITAISSLTDTSCESLMELFSELTDLTYEKKVMKALKLEMEHLVKNRPVESNVLSRNSGSNRNEPIFKWARLLKDVKSCRDFGKPPFVVS